MVGQPLAVRHIGKQPKICSKANFTLRKRYGEQMRDGMKCREARPLNAPGVAKVCPGDWVIFRYGGRFKIMPRLVTKIRGVVLYRNLDELLREEWRQL